MKWFLPLILISFNSYAMDDSCLNQQGLPTLDPIFKKIEKAVGYRAVSDEELLKAPCKTTTPPTHSEIMNFLSQFKGKSKDTIHGVNFSNENKDLIKAFERLTTDKGNGIRKVQLRIQESLKINPECTDVICSVQKIWGEELGLKLLYMMMKYNFNGSEIAHYETSRRFRVSEVDNILMSLGDLPKSLTPLGTKNQRLTISDRSPQVEAGEIYADSGIEIYRNWSYEEDLSKQYILFHELAHNIATKKRNIDENKEWLKLSNWRKNSESEWEANEDSCFVSLYSMSSPYEDMADTITMYRYNPHGLKKLCPKKYEIVKKKVFDGQEYLSKETCKSF